VIGIPVRRHFVGRDLLFDRLVAIPTKENGYVPELESGIPVMATRPYVVRGEATDLLTLRTTADRAGFVSEAFRSQDLE